MKRIFGFYSMEFGRKLFEKMQNENNSALFTAASLGFSPARGALATEDVL